MSVRLAEGVSIVRGEHNTTLLDERSGNYWQLNGSGALILEMLLGGSSEAAAGDRLTERYPVDREQAERDVAALVQALYEAKVVV